MNKKIEVPSMKVPPLKKICMTIGQLPSSYVETMSYYEMLVWFVHYLRDDIIPVVNANSEATRELQELYVELQDYVNNYFENLDVQEEINNKLDEMADSGQLTDIIAQYLGLAGMITFNNVAEMKVAENLVNGSKCATLGFYSVNDGGKALYKIRTITNEDVVDEKFIIAVYDNLLVAELIVDDKLNIKQIGAKGDGETDNTSFIKAALEKVNNIYFPSGEYILNDIITITDKNIIGENPNNTKINEKGYITSREGVIDISGSVIFKNITLEKSFSDTNNRECKVCMLKNCHDSYFENVYFISYGYLTGATIDLYHNNQRITFENCKSILKCIDENEDNARGGLWVRESTSGYTSSNITFNNCYIENTSLDEGIAVWCWNGNVTDVTLNNCYIYGTAENTAPHFTTLECDNFKAENCTFIDLGINTSIGTGKIASMIRGSEGVTKKTYFNNCLFYVNATLSNGYSTNDLATFNNCYFENTQQSSLGKGTYKNCEIIGAEVILSQAICYNTHFIFTNSTGSSLSQWGCELYNCVFDGMNYASGKILFQTFAATSKYIMKNVQFNGTLNYTWFINLPSEANVSKFEIENTLVGDIYRENLITSGYMINCPCIKAPQTLTYVKTNNIFNING